MNAYVLEQELHHVNELFTEAKPNKELITLQNTDLKLKSSTITAKR